MKLVGVGLSCIDLYENLNLWYPTGNSVDFIIHMSRFDYKTSMVTVIGNDVYGKEMIKILNKENVDTSHITIKEGSTALFKMEIHNNDRFHKEKSEGVMEYFELTNEDIEFISKFEYVHTNFSGRTSNYLPLFKENGLQVIFDYSTNVNKKAELTLPYVDYAFFSYKEDDEFIRNYMRWVKRYGTKLVVVTLGDNGSLAYDGKRFYKGTIISTKVVNTVGAGDSFCAGFMKGIISKMSIEECLMEGAKISSEVVGKFKPY